MDVARGPASKRRSEYNTWKNIRQRCGNPKHAKFAYYGGRGIKVCERWASFELFLLDMGARPEGSPTIERLDYNKGYEPGNCKWATWTEQQNNKRNSLNLTLGERTQTVSDWARELGFSEWCIRSRLKMGWSIERALTTPPRPLKRRKRHVA